MKDLKNLAVEYQIKSMLYNGEGKDWVYQLLGESRVTKQITVIREKKQRFIEFLEKQFSVQQHVLLFRSKVEDKSPWNPNSVDRKKQYKIHFTG